MKVSKAQTVPDWDKWTDECAGFYLALVKLNQSWKRWTKKPPLNAP
jgi:hypothetical protein